MADTETRAFRWESRQRLAAAVALLNYADADRLDATVALVGVRALVAAGDLWVERAVAA